MVSELAEYMANQTKDSAQVKEQFAQPGLAQFISLKIDKLKVHSGPIRIFTRSFGTAFVLDSPPNNQLDGTTYALDGYGAGATTLQRVVSHGNTFKDYLRNTDHINTGSTTAVVDTTNFTITF